MGWAVDRREILLSHGSRGTESARRAHIEAIASHGDVRFPLFRRVHLPSPNIFASYGPRFILECNLVVGAFGYEVGILFACGVEEVEFLAPIAVALGFGAVVACGLCLVALEMALPAGQAACARPLGLAICGRVAVSLLRLRWAIAGRVVPRRRGGHGVVRGIRVGGRKVRWVASSRRADAERDDHSGRTEESGAQAVEEGRWIR